MTMPPSPTEAATVSDLLRSRATADPDRAFLRWRWGDLTLGQLDEEASLLARGLLVHGVVPGTVLALLLPNRVELVSTWFAATRAGVVAAPLNTALRGQGLAHALNVTRSTHLVVDAALLDAVAEVATELTHLRSIVVVGPTRGGAPTVGTIATTSFERLRSSGSTPLVPAVPPAPAAMLLFTSGSTGASKACQISHRYLVRHAEVFAEQLGIVETDVLYCPFPLFHIDAAVLTVVPALLTGAVAAIGERFSVSGFWDEVRAVRATVFDFMGATLTMLHQQPPGPRDRDHGVRLAWGVPLPAFAREFEDRFGIRLVELYGSTDAGVVLYPAPEPVPGSCGRPVGTFDVAVHRDDGSPAGPDEVGELVLRPREPSLLADGYFGNPEATLASRRDLWFHTGDLARADRAGNVFFVGRRGDVVRRRGENISALEVEEVLATHPDVAQVAVFGVESELTEQDVKAAVVLRDGVRLTEQELWSFCQGRMARHMVPRYIELMASLPRTPTEKVERHALARRGVSAATTWDAERRGPG